MRRILGTTALALAVVASAIAVASPASAATASVVDSVGLQSVITVMNTSVARPVTISDQGRVVDVTVRVDFRKVSQTCAAPSNRTANSTEIGFSLTSPSGTSVRLVKDQNSGDATYTNNGDTSAAGRVSVLFDDAAPAKVGTTGNRLPVSGTFRPAEPLSAFDGEPAGGTWTLTAIDLGYNLPLCYYGAALTVTTDTPPSLPSGTLADGVAGVAYSAALPAVSGATYTASGLPDGLELNPSSGRITGTPTRPGVFDFLATVTDAQGLDSTPTTFRITILKAATLTGQGAATAVYGQPFSYVPQYDTGFPAATITMTGSLPDGLEFDGMTGAITGIPRAPLGSYPVELRTSGGFGAVAELSLTIDLEAGPVARLIVIPSAVEVDQSGSITLVVAAEDAGGNEVPVAPDELEVASDVPTDVIDGITATFPMASRHTLTVRHLPTGVTESVVIEVRPAAATGDPRPEEPTSSGDLLAATGVDANTFPVVTTAGLLALLSGMLLVRRSGRRRV